MSGRRLRAFGPLLVPGVLALLLFRGVIFLGELPFRRDMSRLFVPLKQVLSQGLREGRLPQWWPWDSLGTPLVAVPVLSTFHPSTLFFVLLPFQAAFVLQMLLPVPLGLWGAWRLGRALGLRPVFAALAATGYVFGGYFLGLMEFTSMSLAAGALPWLWWGALRCRGRGWTGPVAVTLALASMLLAGDPQLSMMGLLVAGVLGLRRGPVRRLARPVVALGASTALAVALAAVQLVPSLHLFRESSRSAGLVLADANYWALDLPQLLGMVFPEAFSGEETLFQNTYLGLGLGALALVGAATRGRARWTLVGVALASLVLALGGVTPLWWLFSAVVPFWKAFQFPVKAIGPAMLVLPLLAARGAQRLLLPTRPRFLPAGVCALAAVAGGGAGAGEAALFAALLAGVLALAAWQVKLRPVLSGVALAVVALDLVVANERVLPTVSPEFYSPPPLVDVLRRQGVSDEGFTYLHTWQPSERIYALVKLEVERNASLLPVRGAMHGLPTSNPYVPGYSARYAELVLGNPQRWVERLAGAYGTRFHLATLSDVNAQQRERAVAIDELSKTAVMPIRRHLPRAYVVQGVKVLPRARVLEYLVSDFRPGQEVVLEAESAGESWAHPLGGPARGAERVRRSGDVLEVEVSLDAPGMLVLNESYYAGVEASEGGQPLPLFPANHAVRAVPLTAGRHLVRFEYQTPGLRAGAGVSTVALLLLAAAGVFQARRWKLGRNG